MGNAKDSVWVVFCGENCGDSRYATNTVVCTTGTTPPNTVFICVYNHARAVEKILGHIKPDSPIGFAAGDIYSFNIYMDDIGNDIALDNRHGHVRAL